MHDRTLLKLLLVVLLGALALYLNADLLRPGFTYPDALLRLLPWQGENVDLRSLQLRRGLDLQGGLQVLLQVDRTKVKTLDPKDVDLAAATIKNRVDILGVAEPLVQTQGEDKIVVELPGVRDPDLAVKTVQKTALLEFLYLGTDPKLQLGESVSTTLPVLFEELPADKQQPFQGDPNEPITSTAAVSGTSPLSGTLGATTATSGTKLTTIYPTLITGTRLRDAGRSLGVNGVNVNFQLDDDGGRRMGDFTRDHHDDGTTKHYMGIALDKEIVSIASIRSQLNTDIQIEGRFSVEEADSLVAQLKSGALPFSLNVVGQTTVGPTLGSDTVSAAVKGGLVGLLVVILFMLIYYRMPGFLASVALILYALLSLALFRLVPVTLTLAGIAGFVLSIGMAVDANILIFERMKEELRAGRRVGQAMEAGFHRAWPSIRDSNMSTLITCFILFWFGNQFGASIVKGFAITLALGVLTSMFTAITVTRTLLLAANHWVLRDQVSGSVLDNPGLRRLFGF